MLTEKSIKAHLDVAERYAQDSHAKRLKVGAVVVKDDRIISIGINGTYPGWDNTCENEDGSTRDDVYHAEENAILKLAGSTESGKGAVMFCTHAPCIRCARMMARVGITEVYYRNGYRDTSGIEFLEKAGGKIRQDVRLFS